MLKDSKRADRRAYPHDDDHTKQPRNTFGTTLFDSPYSTVQNNLTSPTIVQDVKLF